MSKKNTIKEVKLLKRITRPGGKGVEKRNTKQSKEYKAARKAFHKAARKEAKNNNRNQGE